MKEKNDGNGNTAMLRGRRKKNYPKDFEIVMKYIGNLIKVCSDSKVGGLAYKTTIQQGKERRKGRKKIIHINGRGIAHRNIKKS